MSSICQGQTLAKKRCRKSVKSGHYCHLHQNQEPIKEKEIPDADCYICREPWSEETKITFSCGHMMCETCVGQLHKAECPFCRKDLSDEIEINDSPSRSPESRITFGQLREIYGETDAVILLISCVAPEERNPDGILLRFGPDEGLLIIRAFVRHLRRIANLME